MKQILLVFLFSTLLFADIPQILPTPQSVVEKNSRFKITSATKIVLGSDSHAERFIAQQLNDELSVRKIMMLKVVGDKSVRKLSSNFIFIGKPATGYGKKFLAERKGKLTPEMKAEGYFLDSDPNGIVIIAESDKGLFYGAMSLLQMLRSEKRSLTVAGTTIHDFPSQKIRGITDDISRGQVSTPENFKKIVRFCARYKLNVYSPYLEDMFIFKKHTEIGKNRGALSAAECRDLDAYAKKYFVEVIPIFQTLGHWENILLHSDYMKFGEFPGAHTLNISDERVYSMLDEMIGEVSACFSSPYFNIAADESWDVGLGTNKERVKKSDLATVHSEHYKRIFEMVKKYGKKPMMYGDIILDYPDILTKIPQDVTMVDWHYGASFDYTSPEIFSKAGFPYVVSPAVWNFSQPFPNFINTFLNIQNLNLDGFKNGSQGILCSNWNDFGGEALRELNYYGYAWTAECAWNPMNVDQTVFNKKFFGDFFGSVDDDNMQTVYTVLSSPANHYHWYDLWRHPMLPNREDMIWEKRLPLIQRMQSISSTIPFVQELIKESSGKIKRNNDHLQYLSFITKLNLWYATKIKAQETIKLLLKDSTRPAVEISAAVIPLCREVVEQLTDVRSEFEKAWMTTNKPHGLNLLLRRYDRQAAYWNELAEQMRRGDFAVEPAIKSQWIYHPKANPNLKDSVQIQKAFFRKTFTVPNNVISAKLQLIGDTWAKISVNGKFIGEVMARRSLSLIVENERSKIFDILPFLNDSKNVISVESQNFQTAGSAGTNVYSEIVSSDGSVHTIMSDNSWLVSEIPNTGWETVSFNDSSWISASPRSFPYPIVKPNLATGRTSWFER